MHISGAVLQHDDSLRHTARAMAQQIVNPRLECLSHPTYSPDFAPRDYHVSGPLKEAPGGMKFSTDEEIKRLLCWLHS